MNSGGVPWWDVRKGSACAGQIDRDVNLKGDGRRRNGKRGVLPPAMAAKRASITSSGVELTMPKRLRIVSAKTMLSSILVGRVCSR